MIRWQHRILPHVGDKKVIFKFALNIVMYIVVIILCESLTTLTTLRLAIHNYQYVLVSIGIAIMQYTTDWH